MKAQAHLPLTLVRGPTRPLILAFLDDQLLGHVEEAVIDPIAALGACPDYRDTLFLLKLLDFSFSNYDLLIKVRLISKHHDVNIISRVLLHLLKPAFDIGK